MTVDLSRWRWVIALSVTAGLAGAPAAVAQSPDVIVGDLQEVASYGSVGGIYAYAVGTTSCNIGAEELQWQADTPLHPVIGQQIYRYADGRLEQIGLGWLKHGFCALSLTLCGPCIDTPCDTLGIGCSDPYTAGRNGTQANLGPRSDVDAWLGEFPYPFTAPPFEPVIGRRIQVQESDVEPASNPGALYYIEGHYVTNDDAIAGNGENNVSWRRVTIDPDPGEYALQLVTTEPTVQQQPAIYAWQVQDPDVVIEEVRVPGEGLLLLGYKVTNNFDGTWDYEYALYNMNSDISAGSFAVPVQAGTVITDAGFHGVPYHSGEPYSTEPWVGSLSGNAYTWETSSFSVNPDAFALRWSRLFNFRFTADIAPQPAAVSVGLFKTGGEILVNALGPGVPPPAIEPVADLACVANPDGVQISWTNPSTAYTEITVRRQGTLLGTLAGTATEFFDDTAVEGETYEYDIQAFEGIDPAPTSECVLTVPVFNLMVRGDSNDDGATDISDAVFSLAALFVIGSPQPACTDAADVNDDGTFDISDTVYALFSLFVPGSPPVPAPAPTCGYDLTDDDLSCDQFDTCP